MDLKKCAITARFTFGLNERELLSLLRRCNKKWFVYPLPDKEIKTIVKTVMSIGVTYV